MHADDKIIVKKFIEGDVLSFDQIFHKYNKKVYYFALSYLKNKEEAEEVTQEVFLNLWRFRLQISQDYEFNRYIFKITYNAVCKSFRKQASNKKHIENILLEAINEDSSTEIDIEYNSLMESVYQHIDQLPLHQKRVVLLSIKDNLANDQIAKELNISIKTVENQLASARTLLKKMLTEKGILAMLFYSLFLI
jgi:RNA polymerase sigma-70 factor (ECF subfamily)